MAANTSPIFPLTPVIGVANISTGVTTRTVSGVTGLTSLVAAGTNGTRLDSVRVMSTATSSTSGKIALWLYAGSGNAQLFYEILVTANTASSTNPGFSYVVSFQDVVIPTGSTLYVSTYNSEAFNVFAHGGAY